MNLFRIGFIAEAHTSALQALAIFKAEDDDNEGICDAFFQLGSMPYLSVSPGDTPGYLDEAIKGFSVKNNSTGIYLARIQKNIQLFFNTQFDEAIEQNLGLIKELTVPGSENLLCFTYMQMSLGMYIKQDIQQFVKYMQIWQQLAQSTGNFHDFTMTKTMLADCYRIQKLDKAVMEACIEAASYCEQLGSIHGHSTLAIVMANVYNEQGLYDNALEYYNQGHSPGPANKRWL
jgi:tetratricopeptide (TPR) repeat protein